MKKAKLLLIALFVMALTAPGWAGWTIVDDFQGETLNPLNGQTASCGQVWAVSPTSQSSIVVGSQDSSQVLEFLSDTPTLGRADLPLSAVSITEGNSGTLYCRVKLNNVIVGGTNSYIVGGFDGTGTGTDMKTVAVALKNNNDGATGVAFASSSATGTSIAIQLGQWYDLWFYVDLTAADVANYYFEAYIAGPGLEGQVPLTLTSGAVQQPLRSYTAGSGIAYFSAFKNNSTNPSHGGYIDDMYIDIVGKNLTSAINQLKLAHDPTPADGAEEVPQATTLSWYTGLADITDPGSWATSGITHHHVYMSGGNPADPNLIYKTTVAAGAPTASWTPPTLSLDGVYLWRVDEGFNSNPADPGILPGQIWVFDVVHSTPEIVTQPVTMVADVGSNPQFQVDAINPQTGDTTDLNYKWYNAATGLPLNDGAQYSNTTTNTLTVLDAQVGDDMHLFCRVTMATGSTDTDTVGLGVKNRLTYWTLDAAKYTGTAHADEEGFQPAVPATTGTATFTTGADGTANGALVIDSNNWCTAGSFVPEEYSGEMSISLWLNWSGLAGAPDPQYFIAKRKPAAEGSASHFHCGSLYTSDLGPFKVTSSLSPDFVVNPGLTIGQWDHVVVTIANYDGDAKAIKIYLNGLPELSASSFLFGNVLDAVISLGAIDNAGLYPFNGAMDDVAIYNYALSATEVAALYSDINGPYCVAYPEFDYDQSCVVDLGDFAIFAAQWLDCNIFPTCITVVP